VKGTLRTRAQFRRVYDNGEKRVGKYVVVFAYPSEKAVGCRVGVVASRKVGDAVRRNRAKRLLRSAYRPLKPEVRRPCELIFVARRSIVDPAVRAALVEDELRALLAPLGYLSLDPDRALGGQG
jgi:ribonuclease P protein component